MTKGSTMEVNLLPYEYNAETHGKPDPWVIEAAKFFDAQNPEALEFPVADGHVYFIIKVIKNSIFYIHNDTPSGLPTALLVNVDGDVVTAHLGPGRRHSRKADAAYTVGDELFVAGSPNVSLLDKIVGASFGTITRWRVVSALSFLELAAHLWWTPLVSSYGNVLTFDCSRLTHHGVLRRNYRTTILDKDAMTVDEAPLPDFIVAALEKKNFLWQHVFVKENRAVWGSSPRGSPYFTQSPLNAEYSRKILLGVLQRLISAPRRDGVVFLSSAALNEAPRPACKSRKILLLENIVDTRCWMSLVAFSEACVEYAMRYALETGFENYEEFARMLSTAQLCTANCIHALIKDDEHTPLLTNSFAMCAFLTTALGTGVSNLSPGSVCATHLLSADTLRFIVNRNQFAIFGENVMTSYFALLQAAYDVDAKCFAKGDKSRVYDLVRHLMDPAAAPAPKIPIHSVLQNPAVVAVVRQLAVTLDVDMPPQRLDDLFEYSAVPFKEHRDRMYKSIYDYYAELAMPASALGQFDYRTFPPRLKDFFERYLAGPEPDPDDLALCNVCFCNDDLTVEGCGHVICTLCYVHLDASTSRWAGLEENPFVTRPLQCPVCSQKWTCVRFGTRFINCPQNYILNGPYRSRRSDVGNTMQHVTLDDY